METGMRQFIMLRATRYRPPTRISTPQVSPTEPEVKPVISSWLSAKTCSNFIRASGVAVVAAS